jgi:hypothetical protein
MMHFGVWVYLASLQLPVQLEHAVATILRLSCVLLKQMIHSPVPFPIDAACFDETSKKVCHIMVAVHTHSDYRGQFSNRDPYADGIVSPRHSYWSCMCSQTRARSVDIQLGGEHANINRHDLLRLALYPRDSNWIKC